MAKQNLTESELMRQSLNTVTGQTSRVNEDEPAMDDDQVIADALELLSKAYGMIWDIDTRLAHPVMIAIDAIEAHVNDQDLGENTESESTSTNPMNRSAFIQLLAKAIEKEAFFTKSSPEPYRAAGDRLVDDALGHID